MKILILVSTLSLLAFNSIGLRAQSLDDFRKQQVLDAIREKTHTAILPIEKKGASPESIEGDTSLQISTSYPESEVHAAINPSDTTNIVVGPMNISYATGAFNLTFPIYYTSNFGKSWKKSTFKPAPYEAGVTLSGGGDPVFAYDADGKLYFSWIDISGGFRDSSGVYFDTSFAEMDWASSTNGGQTWQRAANGYIGRGVTAESLNPRQGDTVKLDTTTGFDDKEWLTVDRTNSPYHNTLYAAWTHLGVTNYGITVCRKLPGRDTMEAPVRLTSNDFLAVQFTSLGVDAKGGLHVTFMGTRDTQHYALYHSYSGDGGASFSTPVKITDADIPGFSSDAKANHDTVFGIRPNGNYPCPNLSIDTSVTGDLYMVWSALGTTADQQHGDDIYFSRSTDNGATWSPASVINNDIVTGYIDHFYPSIAVNAKGMITVCWYDRREDPFNQIGRYYMAQSTDQGHTWTNAPAAALPMDFNYVMNTNLNFGIGEYTQVLTTSGYTIPVWTDGHKDDGNLRVYAAFLSSGTSDVERLSSVSEGLELLDNYPNPFNTTTKLGFTLGSAAHTTLYVTNIAGQRISTIFDGTSEPGEHDFTFDGSNLPNGTYYLNLESDLGVARSAITILH